MIEYVDFPDVEAICVSYLNSTQTDAKASTKVPNPRPDQFIKVTRVGGSANIGIDSARVRFECWSTDEVAAQKLGSNVRSLVRAMDEYGYENSGLLLNPDPVTNLPRYQFSATLYIAAEPMQ